MLLSDAIAGRRYAPDVAKARQKEQARRGAEARNRAVRILVEQHRAEFDGLYRKLRGDLDHERGLLPGDA